MAPHTFHPGSLVMVDIPGTRLDSATADFLQSQRIRAVCLFRKNLGSEEEVVHLTRDLREVLGPDALIGLDQEGGSVVRSTFLPQAPSAMALGAAADENLAYAVGAAVARGLRSLGINWNFAPVLDVNNNPSNPVIAERSFSEDPEEVTRLAGAWMRGSLSEGIACCAKHFPGHGDTHVDSHLALPHVDKPLAALEAVELRPFSALRGLAPAMMTAHVVYPQLDPDYPATLSRKILGGILRNDWGYDGVVITDALMMKAISERYGYARAAVLAIDAGADMILAQGTQAQQLEAIEALRTAFASGELTQAQGSRACARLDTLAAAYPLQHAAYPSPQRIHDDALMRRAWALGLTRLRGAAPPSLHTPLRVLAQFDVPTDQVSEAGPTGAQAMALFDAFTDVQRILVDDIASLDWAKVPQDGRKTVVVSTRRDRYGATAHSWRPDLHLVLWNPFQALDVPAPTVLSWGYADGALAALKQWLEGRAAAPGHPLPSLA
ncbi:MAG: beta-N-acetylhexosaminidase [Burkholderiaceae bacterium]